MKRLSRRVGYFLAQQRQEGLHNVTQMFIKGVGCYDVFFINAKIDSFFKIACHPFDSVLPMVWFGHVQMTNLTFYIVVRVFSSDFS